MRVTVVKNEKESNERCIARFNKTVQSSRKILLVRKERYHAKSPTKGYVRAAAIKRDYYRGLRQKRAFH